MVDISITPESVSQFASGVQLFGAFLLARGVVVRRLERVFQNGALKIGTFVGSEGSLAIAGRGEVTGFLKGEWSETTSGVALIFIGFAADASSLVMVRGIGPLWPWGVAGLASLLVHVAIRYGAAPIRLQLFKGSLE